MDGSDAGVQVLSISGEGISPKHESPDGESSTSPVTTGNETIGPAVQPSNNDNPPRFLQIDCVLYCSIITCQLKCLDPVFRLGMMIV